MSVRYSTGLGGAASYLNVATDKEKHCVLPIAGSGGKVRYVSKIVATYGFNAVFQTSPSPGSLDYDTNVYRSFTGRLLVVEGFVDHDIATTPAPDILLFEPPNRVDSTIGRVIKDFILHDFKRPHLFEFIEGIKVPDGGLTVILVSGVLYKGVPDNAVSALSQMLDVEVRTTGDISDFNVGKFHAIA